MKEQTKKPEFDEDSMPTRDEAYARAIMILSKASDPKQLTRLNETEIKLLTSIITIGDYVKSSLINDFAVNFMLLRISQKGEGRKEILEIARQATEETRQVGKLRQLLSFGGRL